MDQFERCIKFIRRWEGGLVDDPDDSGGRTAYGVTQRAFSAWLRSRGLKPRDVWTITRDEVDAVYRTDYWVASGADKLPWPLNLAMFDWAVNAGPGRARSMLAAVGMQGSARDRALRFVSSREAFYRRLVRARPKDGKFLRGWFNRTAALRAEIGKAKPVVPTPPNSTGLGRPSGWSRSADGLDRVNAGTLVLTHNGKRVQFGSVAWKASTRELFVKLEPGKEAS